MKKWIFYPMLAITCQVYAQSKSGDLNQNLLKELSKNACDCIGSINVSAKSKEYITNEINKCIDEQVGAYQLGVKLLAVDNLSKVSDSTSKQDVSISINTNKNSGDYKRYYYEMENYLMENCKSMKQKVAAEEARRDKSMSDNKDALNAYSKGVDAMNKENYKKAISQFQKAVAIDPEFAFAWDNLGVTYRKTNELDKAMEAYQRSLAIDSNGKMPLQNIAIVYLYKQEYKKAIDAYTRLSALDTTNPEVFYGIGQVYAIKMGDPEKGLPYMCKAYNLYVQQRSPYRTDAEKIINLIYADMKKQGKEALFNEILAAHHISPN